MACKSIRPKETVYEPPKKRMRRSEFHHLEAEFWMQTLGGSQKSAELRKSFCEEIFNSFEGSLKELQEEWNLQTTEALSDFLQTAFEMIKSNGDVSPVGFIQLDEYDKHSFENTIKHETPHFVPIKPSQCPNVKSAFQLICKHLTRDQENKVEALRTGTTILLKISGFLNETDLGKSISGNSTNVEYDQLSSLKRDFKTNSNFTIDDLQGWYKGLYSEYFEGDSCDSSPHNLRYCTEKLGVTDVNQKKKGFYRKTTPSPRKFCSYDENSTLACHKVKNCIIALDKIQPEDFMQSDINVKRRTGENLTCSSRPILKPQLPNIQKTFPRGTFSKTPEQVVSPCNKSFKPEVQTLFRRSSLHSIKKWKGLLSCGRNCIVVFIEEANLFPGDIVSSLLKLLSASELPFVYVLGMRTHVQCQSKYIPINSHSHFALMTISVIPVADKISRSLNLLLKDRNLFRFGGKTCMQLKRHLEEQHFSTQTLLSIVKFFLLHHFADPKSVFCVPCKSAEVELPEAEVLETFMDITKTPSVNHTKLRVDLARTTLQNWIFGFELLWILNITLQYPLYMDLYIDCATGLYFKPQENDESKFSLFLREIDRLKKPALLNLLEKLISKFAEFYDIFTSNTMESPMASECLSTLKEIAQGCRDLSDEIKNEPDGPIPKTKLKHKTLCGLGARASFKENMRNNIHYNKGEGGYLNIQKMFKTFLEKTFRKHLKPFDEMDEYLQIFVYDSSLPENIAKLHPAPSDNMAVSLLTPGAELRCKCCEDVGKDSIAPCLHDSSIVYKLINEQSFKKIDLNALLESFLSIVEARSKSPNLEENILRFTQAIAELEHCKIIKRWKNKPDEATRLFFGCNS